MDHQIRKASHNGIGGIDLEWKHPEFGWIWFTAMPNDKAPGSEIYAQALQGTVAAYKPPTAVEQRALLPALSRRQLKLGLLSAGITSVQVLQVIEAMPAGEAKQIALIEWEDATVFERHHPLIASVGAALNLTATQIDTIWAAAAN